MAAAERRAGGSGMWRRQGRARDRRDAVPVGGALREQRWFALGEVPRCVSEFKVNLRGADLTLT